LNAIEKGIAMSETNQRDMLVRSLEFHGRRCWASTAGVRVGLAAKEALGDELVTEPHLRVFNEAAMCTSCSGYGR